MGIPYFYTLIDDFFFSKKNLLKPVNLINQNVIIDGYSFFYFIYAETRRQDQSKSMAQRVAATQFGYDGLWEKLLNSLQQFKSRCNEIVVVFDGIGKSDKHRRPDSERASSVIFNDDCAGIPSLIRDEFLMILKELAIKVFVCIGEADPMVVHLAREHNAYIVALDTDYYLYKINRAYVPLSDLNSETLAGPYYEMTDVFQGMTQKGVALWATAIGYDFISLETLQVNFNCLYVIEITFV